MDIRLSVTQNQILSQKMIQSMEILQMSSQELNDYIKEIALENPVVDVEESYETPDKAGDLMKKLEWLDSIDERNRVYYSQEYGDKSEDKQFRDYSEDAGEELSEYLLHQLLTVDLSDLQYDVIQFMVYSLDSKGYMEENLEDIARRFGTDRDFVEEQLKLLQSLEPAGVCARNVQECLRLQLEREEEEDDAAKVIVSDYLELLGKNQLHIISKRTKLPMEEVVRACDHIKELNPKPSRGFDARSRLKYITPDVTVVKLAEYYEILLNEYMYPKIGINHFYKRILESDSSKETRAYISDKIRQAEWIQSCIGQRNSTLMRVSKCIIDYQEAFFNLGIGHLRPLRLQDVAEMLDIHESTVSRAIRDKYLQCAWGVFPMNYFFSKSIAGKNSGEKITTEQVKQLVVAIVEEENKKKPLSDRAITEQLVERGVKICRRTVAKYREELGIKDASGRKRFQ
ncbi:MAG: RNA polymerase sigma-54 factor [Clostridia bacterium]|nr:RNA polymerase factor sigma-54 [Lachnospiraceae bacterium]NCB99856.1 RNA polymerase sigma-54 factor [Clostridia bacterium]NCD02795.1 RNA polymerase sigma-54 factor [Clostridia bacterium]